MRRLKMSWNTEGDHLVCRWIESEEKCEPFLSRRPITAFRQSRKSIDWAVHLAELSSCFWIWQGRLIGTPSPGRPQAASFGSKASVAS